MNFNLKIITKKLINNLGYDIRSYLPNSSSEAQLISSLRTHNIDLVLDVGANTGQFGLSLRKGGYKGSIVSFEPLSTAYKELLITRKKDNKWSIYTQTAIGSENGEIEINIAGNSVSSSIFPMLKVHRTAAPNSCYVGKEIVKIIRIDSLEEKYFDKNKKILLKIDTQGYEAEVLDGVGERLNYIDGILMELSFIPLYEGQLLWKELIMRMNILGFELWAIFPGFTDAINGRTYQFDGLFFKNSK